MPNKISKEKSINRTKTLTEVIVCVVILGTAVYIGKSCIDRARVVPADENVESQAIDVEIPEPTDPVDPNKIVFTSAAIDTRLKFSGDLILVNNDHQYFSTGNENLVSILEKNDEKEISSFTAVDYDYSILETVYDPMAKMIEDWYDIYANDTLIVYGSYRTNEFQQELYERFSAQTSEDGEAPIVAKPGYSEHETGYAFDFSETINNDYQGEGDFAWLNENCYKYGFIIRYAEDKEEITEYRAEPWHFRYVGVPHAKYMADNNLCLEEYTELLSNAHRYDGEHLEVTTDDGAEYEIFFFPSDDGADFTSVPVPTGYKYDISGNNVDGFIVTVHKSEKAGSEYVHPFATTSAVDEDTSTSSGEESEASSEETETTAVQ